MKIMIAVMMVLVLSLGMVSLTEAKITPVKVDDTFKGAYNVNGCYNKNFEGRGKLILRTENHGMVFVYSGKIKTRGFDCWDMGDHTMCNAMHDGGWMKVTGKVNVRISSQPVKPTFFGKFHFWGGGLRFCDVEKR